MKKIKNKKKILIAIAFVVIMLVAYYIYYKNSDTYKEFEKSSQIEELIPYEEEKQEDSRKQSNSKDKEDSKSEETDEENSNGSLETGEQLSNHENNGSSEEEGKDSTNTENNETEGRTEKSEEMMIVHITGEVKNWGVIELPKGSRVIDAVNKAGGFTDSADVEKVNLAYELIDGVKVYIPSKNEEKIGKIATQEYITTDSGNNVITGGDNVKKESKSEMVNINNATQTELETLPGIGPSTALKIISYRNENGKFSSIDDIKNVNGIGDSKFESIKELICV